ncbi:GNAT family N-acetyltransferase [Mucilaginibacter dorajii]|uniref:N-acetyltransferase domain-containing protein n=1 Tax=Mucilaginibacter dorajii TaxID=692994 RepID=A0ABP7PBB9_9SPHI|nr:N-acetyltransferase [Mucilaginibacter dorajii]MCS3734824.1 ribosomal protein S18 acetylase RimI-like enzyme [Mucilaginibacter dorajii]
MVRPATPTDTPALSQLIILAMGQLANKFAGSDDQAKVIQLFEKFAGQTGNQYSYENALVYEDESGVCGMILGYDGGDLEKLRAPFLSYIKETNGFNQPIEDETQPGEYYIDCLSVFSAQQGKGIAKALIKALIEHAAKKGYFTTGLIVHQNNPQAKKLYLNLGFKVVDERVFVGDVYEHLQYSDGR